MVLCTGMAVHQESMQPVQLAATDFSAELASSVMRSACAVTPCGPHTLSLAALRHCVQHAVGSCIVGLARRAQQATEARKGHNSCQWMGPSASSQRGCGAGFGCHGCLQGCCALCAERCVLYDAPGLQAQPRGLSGEL